MERNSLVHTQWCTISPLTSWVADKESHRGLSRKGRQWGVLCDQTVSNYRSCFSLNFQWHPLALLPSAYCIGLNSRSISCGDLIGWSPMLPNRLSMDPKRIVTMQDCLPRQLSELAIRDVQDLYWDSDFNRLAIEQKRSVTMQVWLPRQSNRKETMAV